MDGTEGPPARAETLEQRRDPLGSLDLEAPNPTGPARNRWLWISRRAAIWYPPTRARLRRCDVFRVAANRIRSFTSLSLVLAILLLAGAELHAADTVVVPSARKTTEGNAENYFPWDLGDL